MGNLNRFLALLLLSCLAQSECFQSGLASRLQGGCSTFNAFCNDLLSGSPKSTSTVTSTVFAKSAPTKTTTVGFGTTIFKTRTFETIGITRKTQVTVGRVTKTVTGCVPKATCGHFTASPGPSLREACTCIVGQPTSTSLSTLQGGTSTSTVFASTSTRIVKSALSKTTIITKTKLIPTAFKHVCSTAAPPSNSCGNEGHQWAQFTLTKKDAANVPDKWNLNTYKSRKPDVNGTSTLIGDIFQEYDPYYYYYEGNNPNYPADYSNDETLKVCSDDYINDRGYIFAPQTGKYVFDISAYGQAAFIWVGDVAVSKYNVSNALVKGDASYAPLYGNGPFNTKFLQAGQYYPIRTAWRCTQSRFDFYLQITQPDGHIMQGEYFRSGRYDDFSVFNDPNSVKIFSPYIVQFGCGKDAKLAPEYPDWGSEMT